MDIIWVKEKSNEGLFYCSEICQTMRYTRKKGYVHFLNPIIGDIHLIIFMEDNTLDCIYENSKGVYYTGWASTNFEEICSK